MGIYIREVWFVVSDAVTGARIANAEVTVQTVTKLRVEKVRTNFEGYVKLHISPWYRNYVVTAAGYKSTTGKIPGYMGDKGANVHLEK